MKNLCTLQHCSILENDKSTRFVSHLFFEQIKSIFFTVDLKHMKCMLSSFISLSGSSVWECKSFLHKINTEKCCCCSNKKRLSNFSCCRIPQVYSDIWNMGKFATLKSLWSGTALRGMNRLVGIGMHRFHNCTIDVRFCFKASTSSYCLLHDCIRTPIALHETFDCIVPFRTVPLCGIRTDHGHFESVSMSVELQSTHTWNPISHHIRVLCTVKCTEINFLVQLTVCGLRWLSRKQFRRKCTFVRYFIGDRFDSAAECTLI